MRSLQSFNIRQVFVERIGLRKSTFVGRIVDHFEIWGTVSSEDEIGGGAVIVHDCSGEQHQE